jgi:molybdopterin synthase sulfur carrier subunit
MPKVLMFGALEQVAGWRERVIDVDTLQELRLLLAAEDVGLGARLASSGVFAVVNHDMVRGDQALTPGDEVAFIPPVSGG